MCMYMYVCIRICVLCLFDTVTYLHPVFAHLPNLIQQQTTPLYSSDYLFDYSHPINDAFDLRKASSEVWPMTDQ